MIDGTVNQQSTLIIEDFVSSPTKVRDSGSEVAVLFMFDAVEWVLGGMGHKYRPHVHRCLWNFSKSCGQEIYFVFWSA